MPGDVPPVSIPAYSFDHQRALSLSLGNPNHPQICEPTTLPTPNIPNKMVMSAYDTRPFKRLASSSMCNIYAGMNVAKLCSSTPIRRHCDVDVFGHVVRVSTTVTKQMRTREAYVQAVAVAWGDNISVVASRVASRAHRASHTRNLILSIIFRVFAGVWFLRKNRGRAPRSRTHAHIDNIKS